MLGAALLLLCLGTAPADSAGLTGDPCLTLASHLLEMGEDEEAITELRRYLFFHPESESRERFLSSIGDAFRRLGRFDEAYSFYQRAAAVAESEEAGEELRVDKALMQLAMKNYDLAEFQLSRIRAFAGSATTRERASFLQTVNRAGSYQWTGARDSWRESGVELDSGRFKSVDSLLAVAASAGHLSSSRAKWLSTFLPGAGQIYAGQTLAGLHALVLSLGFGALVAKSIADEEYGLALVVYLPFFQRYYRGNRYHAVRLAEERNRRLDQERAERIIQEIARRD